MGLAYSLITNPMMWSYLSPAAMKSEGGMQITSSPRHDNGMHTARDTAALKFLYRLGRVMPDVMLLQSVWR